jgi:hypothetical protein
MLFFHIPLNRYVVLELKLGKFRPEYAGQINFYVNVVDEQMRRDHHDATIGLVLCASRNEGCLNTEARQDLPKVIGQCGAHDSS